MGIPVKMSKERLDTILKAIEVASRLL